MKKFKNSGISRGGLMYTGVARQGKLEIPADMDSLCPNQMTST